MQQRLCTPRLSLCKCGIIALTAIIVLTLSLPANALGVTAAEKRAEADDVYAKIDSLQTSLNEIIAKRDEAQANYDEAVALYEEAQQQMEEASEHMSELQKELGGFAKGMYKQGGSESFLDVILQTNSFEDFVTTWDACNVITSHGAELIKDARETRRKLQEASDTYAAQSKRAEEEMASAEESIAQIEETQAALREEAEKITAEAAELQAQEELAAEAARQAELARQLRESQLAAAASEGADAAGESVLMGSGFFTNPCPAATNSSGFGYRSFDGTFHKGLDMAAPEGTPYYAADSGTVMYATYDGGWNGGAGNWVVISHGNGIVTKYMHSSAVFVSPGDYVERGQNIGLVGQTGQAFGAHLHFQVEVDGVAVNPLNYI